jgi:hypothetical protein
MRVTVLSHDVADRFATGTFPQVRGLSQLPVPPEGEGPVRQRTSQTWDERTAAGWPGRIIAEVSLVRSIC